MLSERAGRRDEPTTTLESVIGDDGDVGEGRHCATAAACNLPSRRSVRDCLAAAAGLSVEAEARAFIITVGWTGRLFNQREEGEHTQLAHSPMKEKKKKKANRFFAQRPPLRHQEWLDLSLERGFQEKVRPAGEDRGESEIESANGSAGCSERRRETALSSFLFFRFFARLKVNSIFFTRRFFPSLSLFPPFLSLSFLPL